MLNLIIDRTQNDINQAKNLISKVKMLGIDSLSESQKEEYFSGLKGCYNISDLNRVEDAMKYISDLLNKFSYINEITYKKFNLSDIIKQDEIDEYLENLNILKVAFNNVVNAPSTPTNYKHFNNANDIEKILLKLETILRCFTNNFIYSGVANSGQARTWQKRFRTNKAWTSQGYRFNQYAAEDKMSMLMTNNNKTINRKTKKLQLTQLDDFDDVYASVQSLNNSMQILDDLVGDTSVYF